MGRDQVSKFKTFLVLLGGLGTLAGGVIFHEDRYAKASDLKASIQEAKSDRDELKLILMETQRDQLQEIIRSLQASVAGGKSTLEDRLRLTGSEQRVQDLNERIRILREKLAREGR